MDRAEKKEQMVKKEEKDSSRGLGQGRGFRKRGKRLKRKEQ